MLTFMLLDTVQVNMTNCACESIIWNDDEMQDKGRPLILDTINIQTDPTHVKCLRIKFFMAISMVLVVWTD